MFDVPIHLLWTVHENLLSVSVHWCRAPTERVFIHYMYTHGRRTGGEITGNYRGQVGMFWSRFLRITPLLLLFFAFVATMQLACLRRCRHCRRHQFRSLPTWYWFQQQCSPPNCDVAVWVGNTFRSCVWVLVVRIQTCTCCFWFWRTNWLYRCHHDCTV